jgi:hypothetical protein
MTRTAKIERQNNLTKNITPLGRKKLRTQTSYSYLSSTIFNGRLDPDQNCHHMLIAVVPYNDKPKIQGNTIRLGQELVIKRNGCKPQRSTAPLHNSTSCRATFNNKRSDHRTATSHAIISGNIRPKSIPGESASSPDARYRAILNELATS